MGWLAHYVPILRWARTYDQRKLTSDMIAAIIVTIMLIPQSLAYAMLAGMPPVTGLYASIAPLIAYAMFGTSSSLSVGPVAITSLMTMTALAEVTAPGSVEFVDAAVTLAALSGLILLGFGVLRLGFLASFLSHAVVSSFITASAVIIALSQGRHLLGVNASGDNVIEQVEALVRAASATNPYTLAIGLGVLVFLLFVRMRGTALLRALGFSRWLAQALVRTAPVVGVLVTIVVVYLGGLVARDVSVVGAIPSGLPALVWPNFSLDLVDELWLPAALISIIGYVESISVGRTLGARRRESVDSNQELVGLGAANLAASVSGAFPVTGGFSRSVVNFDAGALTQAASIYTAVMIALVSLFLTPFLYYLPTVTLAVTIIVAVLSLVDLSIIRRTWRFSRSDFLAVMMTLLVTLALGVEAGVACGVLVSLGLHLYHTSRPHIAEVGQVPDTEHYRNVRKFVVNTVPEVLTLRMDESMYFVNASKLTERVFDAVFHNDRIAHVILQCSAINEIDYSALEELEELNQSLREQGVLLHLSELKGPVSDRLMRSHFLDKLGGRIYLSQHQAYSDLCRRYGYC